MTTDTLPAEAPRSLSDPSPAVAKAIKVVEQAGYEVRIPRAKHAPAVPREYAPTADIRAWLDTATERLGSQQAVAEAVNLKGIGPIHAGSRGRPMTLQTFRGFEARLARRQSRERVNARTPDRSRSCTCMASASRRPASRGGWESAPRPFGGI